MSAPDPWQFLAPSTNPSAAPPPDVLYEDNNGPLLIGDPFLDPGRYPPPGCFANVQVSILSPHYKNELFGAVTVPGVGTTVVQLPTATLPWTASPQFRVGYNFSQGAGAIALTYRFLVDQGSGIIPNFDAAGGAALNSRLNVNVVDIDYLTREYGVGPLWDLRWTVGARIVSNYFDTRAQGALVEQRVSNFAFGAGPHAAMELWRWLEQPGRGLALYGKADGAFTFGRMEQNFEENFLANGVPVVGGASRIVATSNASPGNGASQWMPIVHVQAGVTWVPTWGRDSLRFSGGYDFEGWWWVGRTPGPLNGASTATLTTNGIFLRAEWRY
jgi:major outer membrane protein